jgi:tetratricopeptide (TPR) repeat protein
MIMNTCQWCGRAILGGGVWTIGGKGVFCSERCCEEWKRQHPDPDAVWKAEQAAERARSKAAFDNYQEARKAERQDRTMSDKENARPFIQQRLGRPVNLDEVWYHERLGQWVYKEELLSELRAAQQYLAALSGFALDKKCPIPPDPDNPAFPQWSQNYQKWGFYLYGIRWLTRYRELPKDFGRSNPNPSPDRTYLKVIGNWICGQLGLVFDLNDVFPYLFIAHIAKDRGDIDITKWAYLDYPSFGRFEVVDLTVVWEKFEEARHGKNRRPNYTSNLVDQFTLSMTPAGEDHFPVYAPDTDQWWIRYQKKDLRGNWKDGADDVTQYVTRYPIKMDKTFPAYNFDYSPFNKAILGLPVIAARAAPAAAQGTEDVDYYMRGSFSDNVDDAIADFTKAVELDPNHAKAYYKRGRRYNDKKDYDKAIADFAQAAKLDPNDDSYKQWLASAYNERAVACYKKKLCRRHRGLNPGGKAGPG